MFKHVLLCYDGSRAGRAALKQGAELAILVGAKVHVLSIISSEVPDPVVLAGAAATMLLGASAFAQTEPAGEGKRKVKSKVAPAYPELARRMSIAGKVKIEVTISPDGRVKSSHAIGGHPVLVQACQEALKEWKFAAAPEESTQVVEFEFGGSNN